MSTPASGPAPDSRVPGSQVGGSQVAGSQVAGSQLAGSQVAGSQVAGSQLNAEISEWLFREAELLDDGFERKWLEEMVSRDIVYQLPLRQTVERARGAGWVDGTYHLDERYGSLETRVARNETAYAWAEDPPSRIRHFVTNIRASRRPDGLIAVRSNLLVYRTRQDHVVPQLLSGERHDVLRREDGGLRLLERRVLLDVTAIGTHNLSIFF